MVRTELSFVRLCYRGVVDIGGWQTRLCNHRRQENEKNCLGFAEKTKEKIRKKIKTFLKFVSFKFKITQL
jgi:hypothetical protein